MYPADVHLHSSHSFDSRAPMSVQCGAALERGLREICFTEHFSLNPQAPTFGLFDWAPYRAEWARTAAEYSGRLTVRKGIELCEPHIRPEAYRALFADEPVDMIAGSIHNVRGRKLRALALEDGARRAYRAYFTELLEMVRAADIDVVAHLNLINRYTGEPFDRRELDDCGALIEEILRVTVTRGLALEINSSAWGSLGQMLPGREILSLYARLGGTRLTFGSDAHTPERVGVGLAQAAELAKACGFTGFTTFAGRVPTAHPFE